jgi:hypothetical protein
MLNERSHNHVRFSSVKTVMTEKESRSEFAMVYQAGSMEMLKDMEMPCILIVVVITMTTCVCLKLIKYTFKM